MNITTQLFKDMIISATNNLSNHKDEIDRLNVFPVPDGDTGKNMFLTMNGASAVAKTISNETIGECSNKIASATLKSARGNSGVILSQLFRGLSKGFAKETEVSSDVLAAAFKAASDSAYKAVMKPTEGTILTVARESAQAALEAAKTTDDCVELLKLTVDGAKKSLDRTPDLLPKLKEAGVVDSGGMGWVCILEGMLYFLENGVVVEEKEPSPAATKGEMAQVAEEEITFGYCTEFIIEKKNNMVDVKKYKKTISPLGDCMLVIEDFDVVKTHIHTDNPGIVLEEALKLGAIINIKIDNMRYQHNETINETKESKPQENVQPKERKAYSVIAISDGSGFSEIFSELGVTKIVEGGQTMNPSAGDIAQAIEEENADDVYLLPNNKNIILAAEQSKALVNSNVHIIPTTTVPQGIAAAIAFDTSLSHEDNAKQMSEQAAAIKTGFVTYAVRNSQFEDIKIGEGDIIGLADKKIVTACKDINACAQSVCKSICDDDTEVITVYYGKEVSKEQAQAVVNELESEYEDCEVYLQYGGQDVYYYIISAE